MNNFEPTFEFASLRFAELWFCYEKRFWLRLRSTETEVRLRALGKALQYFRVARNLPKSRDTGVRYELLLPILDKASRLNADESHMAESVRSLAREIGEAYGVNSRLSLASKLLWLLRRDPFIVYDSQARNALRTRDGDYDAFVAAWIQRYREKRDAIRNASAALDGLVAYLRCACRVTVPEMKSTSAEEWFLRRVLDVWLWTAGARDKP